MYCELATEQFCMNQCNGRGECMGGYRSQVRRGCPSNRKRESFHVVWGLAIRLPKF